MKNFLQVSVSLVFFTCRVAWRRALFHIGRHPRPLMTVLYYHGIPASRRQHFAAQLDILARHAKVVPADWTGSADPVKPTVAITFDDAFVSVFDNALPELRKYGFPCTIFVPTGVLGNRPDWEMEDTADRSETVVDATRLKQAASSLTTIGSHGVSHLHLTQATPDLARAEIRQSRCELEQVLGIPVSLFAFPYGDYDDRLVSVCQEEGYKRVFVIGAKSVDLAEDKLVRGRVSVDPGDTRLEFFLKVHSGYAWMASVSRLKRRLQSISGGGKAKAATKHAA